MRGLFGEIQISEQVHERCQNPARFRPVKSLNGPADLSGTGGGIYAKLANGMARHNCVRASPAHNLVARHCVDRGFAKGQQHRSS
jgi:hypothetical protein